MFPIRDHNPSERVPWVTFALIGVNVLVFLGTYTAQGNDLALFTLYRNWALWPFEISQGQNYASLVSSTFLHGGILHLAGNMLFLWIFGDNMEDQMGHLGFAGFYLAAGIAASLFQVASDPYSQVPVIGASGAVAGVMGAYLLFFPRARVDVFLFLIIIFRVFTVPAWIVLALWFGLQVFNGAAAFGDAQSGGVAYWAHAGGFAAGLVFALPFWLARGGRDIWRASAGRPNHPEAKYRISATTVPQVKRRR